MNSTIGVDDDCGQNHGPATNVIRESAGGEERRQQAEGVGRENDGDDNR
jgi:hypothetical protein